MLECTHINVRNDALVLLPEWRFGMGDALGPNTCPFSALTCPLPPAPPNLLETVTHYFTQRVSPILGSEIRIS